MEAEEGGKSLEGPGPEEKGKGRRHVGLRVDDRKGSAQHSSSDRAALSAQSIPVPLRTVSWHSAPSIFNLYYEL